MHRFSRNKVSSSDNDFELRNSRQSFDTLEGHRNDRPINRSRSVNNDEFFEDNSHWVTETHTVRRTTSLHRNARQSAMIFLPSRHITNIGAVDNKLVGMDVPLLNDELSGNRENQVEHIVQQMEKVDTFMEDTPDAEEMRLEALRDLPQSLSLKRNIRAKITASVSRKSKNSPINFFRRTKYRFAFWRKKMHQNFRDITFSMELWYESIKSVEGHYGSGVATYFRFLRWLFIMNLFVSIIIISFIIIPQALYATYNTVANKQSSFSFEDIFTGQGSFTNSIMYYGYYSPKILNIIKGLHFSIPLSYIWTMLVVYVVMIVVLCIRLARSYRTSFIETSGGLKNVLANKIFCGWDFSISSPQTAILKSRSIYNELRELLSVTCKDKEIESLSSWSLQLLVKSLIHAFAIGLICIVGVLMVILTDYSLEDFEGTSSGFRVLMAIIVTLIMVVMSIIFSFIVKYEQYNNPRTAVFITLLRTFVLEAVVVSILMVMLLKPKHKCWETSLAQEMYRLIMYDFLFSIIALPLLEMIRTLIYKHCWKKIGMPEFEIALHTLGLIYNQTLLWIGLFYSPMLSVVVTMKMFILFYLKKLSIRYICQPSTKSWRATQTETFFLLLTFVSLLAISVTLGYTFTLNMGNCGPFNEYKTVFDTIVKGILKLTNGSALYYITKPSNVIMILCAMCIVAYFLRSKALVQKDIVKILREMLVLESKDKEFLLNAIKKVAEGDWVYSQKQNNNSNVKNSSPWNLSNDDRIRKPSNADYQFDVSAAHSPMRMNSPKAAPPQSPLSVKPSSSGMKRHY